MNIQAKQVTEIATSRFDITTILGFFGQIKNLIAANNGLAANLSTVWTAYTAAYTAFDDAYAQTHKWVQTEDLTKLDTERDAALSAFLAALKALLTSPNQTKQQAAKRLQFIRDKYNLSTGDEYMKETTAVSQMIQEMEATQQSLNDLAATGLDDWFNDLKAKNTAFLDKMNERTEAQAGLQRGIVRETRLRTEAAYKDVVKLINALAIVEIPEGFDYNRPIDLLNAEIEHYRQILARKGVSTGGSNNNGGSTPSPDPSTGSGTDDPNTSGGGDTPDPNTGGDTPDPNTGGDPSTGSGTGDPNTGGGDTPGGNGGGDPSTGSGTGDNGGGGDDENSEGDN